MYNTLKRIKNSFKYAIIIDNEYYNYLQLGKKINNGYSIDLIKVLLNEYYYNLIKQLKNKEKDITIYLKEHNNHSQLKIYSNINFILTLENYYQEGLLNNNDYKKIKYLKSIIDYKKCFTKIKHDNFVYYYKQIKKSTSAKRVIKLFELDNSLFIKKINNNIYYVEYIIILI